jgi:hypothetical protein
VDWQTRTAYVVPTQEPRLSRWLGEGAAMGFELCQMSARVRYSSKTLWRTWGRSGPSIVESSSLAGSSAQVRRDARFTHEARRRRSADAPTCAPVDPNRLAERR